MTENYLFDVNFANVDNFYFVSQTTQNEQDLRCTAGELRTNS